MLYLGTGLDLVGCAKGPILKSLFSNKIGTSESREAALNTTIVNSWTGKRVAVAETSGEMAAACKHYGVHQ
jgi:hypothetical protein